ncbi:hypothetical protein SAMN05920897_1044 [Alkalispirochaeta americana]|uniref:Uncharacterized protein n=1 Tax=Alkalispirochaeta americana TaxID=159291 RepID=A0A1N6Q4J5_9SPIO|nr:hypothetical protein SAMN05920897_1044 [Alkalispirochaeta americana]
MQNYPGGRKAYINATIGHGNIYRGKIDIRRYCSGNHQLSLIVYNIGTEPHI